MKRGCLVDIGDTRLHVVERGRCLPVVLLHGGPGLDHHNLADYLDPLAEDHRLILADQRGHGRSALSDPLTWTRHQLATDVVSLALALELPRCALLGHSFSASVAMRWAIDFPGEPGPAIVSAGLPHRRYMGVVRARLRALEPQGMRRRVAAAWAREAEVRTAEEVARLLSVQLPFHFADPCDSRIADYTRRSTGAVYAPPALRHFVRTGFDGVDVEDRLAEVRRPVLVLAGRHDRFCALEGARAIADAVPGARLVVFEKSAHMAFVEETDRDVDEVRSFLADTCC